MLKGLRLSSRGFGNLQISSIKVSNNTMPRGEDIQNDLRELISVVNEPYIVSLGQVLPDCLVREV